MKKKIKRHNKTVRLRVKKALDRRKNVKHFSPTIEQCQSWFRILNRGMFGRNLIAPVFRVRRMIYDWGLCVADWDNRKCRAGRFNQKLIPYHVPIKYKIEFRRSSNISG